MHCVDLGESFPTSIYLQNLASIQPRTSFVKFARSPRTDPPGVCTAGCANNIMLIYVAVLFMWKGACNATHFGYQGLLVGERRLADSLAIDPRVKQRGVFLSCLCLLNVIDISL